MLRTETGRPLLGVIVVMAAVLGVMAWQWGDAQASDAAQPSAVVVTIGDQCLLVPTSCHGPIPSTTFVNDEAPHVEPAPDLIARPFNSSAAPAPAEAAVPVPAPPPRSV